MVIVQTTSNPIDTGQNTIINTFQITNSNLENQEQKNMVEK